ncbi:MAG TPA: AsmA-like C-terminal region-containing protein [Bryobacteraceae bacterium]|nr:AsmA-like C-terminal region-containing protein [Bryobacteraceae bacterium]
MKMVETSSAAAPTRRRIRRWILVGAGVVVAWVVVAGILLALNWPFTEAAVAKTLQDRFARQVRIRKFRGTYFPPGCVAEGVDFLHRKRKDLPPLITVETLTLRTGYTGLFRITKLIDYVRVTGLHIRVPPKNPNSSQETFPLTNSVSGKTVTIGEITTDNAVVEFLDKQLQEDKFILKIDHLTLDHVAQNDPVTFHARFKNTEPPGEIRSDGRFGPWNDDDPGGTQLSGSYTYEHVKLGVFEGIAGTLSSQGKFSGRLGHIDAEGSVDVPDFAVSGSKHPDHLASNFNAVIDGTNGDTYLTRVESHFRKTTVISQGDVKGHAGQHGKTVMLNVSVAQGRIEDLLHLFTGSPRPAEVGDVRLQTKVELPPGPQSFLRRLRLEGEFGIGSGHFTNREIQLPVNRLAESARGESKQQEEADQSVVLSNLKGHVSANGGIAKLSKISFTEPGTFAEMEGTYNLLDNKIRLRGVLHTNGKLADTKTGFKSLVLKAMGPFLKKKSVTVVPFEITGTASDPRFSLDLTAKR